MEGTYRSHRRSFRVDAPDSRERLRAPGSPASGRARAWLNIGKPEADRPPCRFPADVEIDVSACVVGQRSRSGILTSTSTRTFPSTFACPTEVLPELPFVLSHAFTSTGADGCPASQLTPFIMLCGGPSRGYFFGLYAHSPFRHRGREKTRACHERPAKVGWREAMIDRRGASEEPTGSPATSGAPWREVGESPQAERPTPRGDPVVAAA
jgi:hypothetical protein